MAGEGPSRNSGLVYASSLPTSQSLPYPANSDSPAASASDESLVGTAAEHEKLALLGNDPPSPDGPSSAPAGRSRIGSPLGNEEGGIQLDDLVHGVARPSPLSPGLSSGHLSGQDSIPASLRSSPAPAAPRRRHNTKDKKKAILSPLHKRNRSNSHAAAAHGKRHPLPLSHTNPLFPPLPLYGPPSLLRSLRSTTLRVSSFVLSLSFLGVVVLGTLFTAVPGVVRRVFAYMTLRDPDATRPFRAEEKRRKQLRREMDRNWKRRQRSRERSKRHHRAPDEDKENPAGAGVGDSTYTPTEGGPDPLVCDVGYYARCVGLDVEEFEVQTEDGFIIDLWHVYDPNEYAPLPPEERQARGPTLLFDELNVMQRERREQEMLAEHAAEAAAAGGRRKPPKFPVLLIHGLLQSAGAYCVNDDDSLAFYLCKSGYDVWLGNNRCGFHPKHAELHPSDPRMWCWNIRQMGVYDLPALASRVLRETRFARLGLVCHSQGTTETLVALAKEQRPALGQCLTVFCALAPAAYAGPLIGKMYFKFMRIISPAMFRLVFGIHAFIPIMMQAHPRLPGRLYGWMGYRVFSFLFQWTDRNWDRGLRDRMFQFAPVYVSAESMRWWLGQEGFARHKCILSTKEVWRQEEEYDRFSAAMHHPAVASSSAAPSSPASSSHPTAAHRHHHPPGSTAWYDEQVPPIAMWVAGRDDLVDGRKLLKRFLPAPAFAVLNVYGQGPAATWGNRTTNSGNSRSLREPHVRVVHAKFLPDYEHLDVIWAMDAVDEVFCEIREVLWKTCPVRDGCRMPKGCENVPVWEDTRRIGRLGGGRTTDEPDISSSATDAF